MSGSRRCRRNTRVCPASIRADHPDVVKMRREIEALKKETGGSVDPQEQSKQLARLRADLATARDKYSDDHPDIVKLKKSIAALEAEQPVRHRAKRRRR